jgi:hypothetical protein
MKHVLPSRVALTSPALAAMQMREDYRCSDGTLNVRDIAKAAGVTSKEARRQLEARIAQGADGYTTERGAGFNVEASLAPPPGTITRAELALILAKRMEIGRFGIQRRVAERAKKGKRMSTGQHPWKAEKHGRSVKAQPGGAQCATLTCSRCPEKLTIRFRQLAGSDDMDKKFIQQGWAVDPAKCPDHNRHNHAPRKETKMPDTAAPPTFAVPTPAAIAAQAKMFGLLQAHFDPDTGVYGGGYSDQKIAADCKLSVDLVAGVRAQAFGELKVPNEVAQLTADIDALESMLNEAVAPIQTELAALKQRVRECCKKFGG